MFLCACNNDAPKEKIIMPEGFTGPVIIVFEKGKEQEPRDYYIPQNGIFYSDKARVSGNLDQEFYYQNKAGEKKVLESIYLPVNNPEEYDSSAVYVQRGFDGQWGNMKYIYFLVGTIKQTESLKKEAEKKLKQIKDKYPDKI